tara:strand:+ start:4619 stop:4837 length:219 start_codon:yes stop_codon:yes gene_type:complete
MFTNAEMATTRAVIALESHVGCAEWAPAVAVGGAKDSDSGFTQCRCDMKYRGIHTYKSPALVGSCYEFFEAF